jgi:glyoxylase I family protein
MKPLIDGSCHLTLTVSDIVRSSEWYAEVFGFISVRQSSTPTSAWLADGREQSFIFHSLFHVQSRFFLGLAQPVGITLGQFDWSTAGLQHFGLHVTDRSDLDGWVQHLEKLGIEHSVLGTEGPGEFIRFFDPDGIAMEVYWPNLPLCEQLWTQLARARATAASSRRKTRRAGRDE